MKKIIMALLITLFLVSSAHATFISFDSTGSGVDANLLSMDEWQMVAYAEVDPYTGESGDVFTYQDMATGLFTEDFTMRVTEGRDTSTSSYYAFPPFFVDVDLTGQYYSDTNIQFSTGAVQMYDDIDNDGNYSAGDIDIATLSMTSALVSQLSGSLLGTMPLGMKVDLSFTFDTVNSLYFGQTEEDLTSAGWLLSVVAGRVDQESLTSYTGPNDDQYIIRWDNPGFQAEFSQVPEPGTLLLLGVGLLGLAGYTRKRKMRRM